MKLLTEKTSPDGLVVAKIYDDEGAFYTEFYVNGALQRSFPGTNMSLEEVTSFASQWVGSVQQLNG